MRTTLFKPGMGTSSGVTDDERPYDVIVDLHGTVQLGCYRRFGFETHRHIGAFALAVDFVRKAAASPVVGAQDFSRAADLGLVLLHNRCKISFGQCGID